MTKDKYQHTLQKKQVKNNIKVNIILSFTVLWHI